MTVLVIGWFVVWVTMGIFIADKKGFSRARGIIDALLFGPFVLLLFLAKQTKKKCTYCGEWVKTEAKVCRYCQKDLPTLAHSGGAESVKAVPGGNRIREEVQAKRESPIPADLLEEARVLTEHYKHTHDETLVPRIQALRRTAHEREGPSGR
jgi:hypothetical protein